VPRLFYRIVKTNPPTIWDFLSHQERGVIFRRPLDAEALRISTGVSVYEDEEQARSTAELFRRKHGRYIAAAEIDEEGPIHWERTTANPGHYTLWGKPEEMLARVRSVVSV
jgi:hypothetical protein